MKIIIALVSACLALVGVNSACPNVTVLQNFDVPAYTGLWYEIARLPTRNEPSGSCTTAHYTLSNNPDEPVDVFNREFNDGTQQYQNITGTARPADDSGESRLLVSFPVAPFPAPYWVLDTDYENYALVHSCVSVGPVESLNGWILSRATTLSQQDLLRINNTISANGLDVNKYVLTRQDDDCSYEGA